MSPPVHRATLQKQEDRKNCFRFNGRRFGLLAEAAEVEKRQGCQGAADEEDEEGSTHFRSVSH